MILRKVKWLSQEHSAGEQHVTPSHQILNCDVPRTPQPLLDESRHSLFSLHSTQTKAKGGGLSFPWLQRQGVGGRQGPWEAAFPMQQLQGSFYPRPHVLSLPRDQYKKKGNKSSNSPPAQVAVPNPRLLPNHPTSLSPSHHCWGIWLCCCRLLIRHKLKASRYPTPLYWSDDICPDPSCWLSCNQSSLIASLPWITNPPRTRRESRVSINA